MANETASLRALSFGLLGLAAFSSTSAITTAKERSLQASARLSYVEKLAEAVWGETENLRVRDEAHRGYSVERPHPLLGPQRVTVIGGGTDPYHIVVKVSLGPGERGFSGTVAVHEWQRVGADACMKAARNALLGSANGDADERADATMALIESKMSTTRVKMPFVDAELPPAIVAWVSAVLGLSLALALRRELSLSLLQADRTFFLLRSERLLELAVGGAWVSLTCVSPVVCVASSLSIVASLMKVDAFSRVLAGLQGFALVGLLMAAVLVATDLLGTVLRQRKLVPADDWDRADD